MENAVHGWKLHSSACLKKKMCMITLNNNLMEFRDLAVLFDC